MNAATAGSPVLSPQVGSTPVVMFFLNIQDRRMIPSWAEVVDEIRKEPATQGQPSGSKLLEGKKVMLEYALDDIEKMGDYIPLRLVVVQRFQGMSRRMALVCVRKGDLKPDDRRMRRDQEAGVRRLLQEYLWDVRVYRNPGDQGGNFIIEAGNPKPAKVARSLADLRVNEETAEFESIDGDDFE